MSSSILRWMGYVVLMIVVSIGLVLALWQSKGPARPTVKEAYRLECETNLKAIAKACAQYRIAHSGWPDRLGRLLDVGLLSPQDRSNFACGNVRPRGIDIRRDQCGFVVRGTPFQLAREPLGDDPVLVSVDCDPIGRAEIGLDEVVKWDGKH